MHHAMRAAEAAFRRAEGNADQAAQNFPQALSRQLGIQGQELAQSGGKQLRQIADALGGPASHAASLDLCVEQSTLLHIRAVHALLDQLNWTADKIDVVGYHGQTVYHAPDRGQSIQLGHPQQLADRTGIRTGDR